jgi:hypothetical protein
MECVNCVYTPVKILFNAFSAIAHIWKSFLLRKPEGRSTPRLQRTCETWSFGRSVGPVSCCWPPPAQSFLVPGFTGPKTILFCLTSLNVNMTDSFTANKYSTHVWINYRQILPDIMCREEVPILSWLRHIIKLRICQWNVITSSPDTPSNKPSVHVTYTLLRHAVFVQTLLWGNYPLLTEYYLQG